MILLGCVRCVMKYFGHKLVVAVLMRLSHIHTPHCMLYKHCSISNQVDANGHGIANLFPSISEQLYTQTHIHKAAE